MCAVFVHLCKQGNKRLILRSRICFIGKGVLYTSTMDWPLVPPLKEHPRNINLVLHEDPISCVILLEVYTYADVYYSTMHDNILSTLF